MKKTISALLSLVIIFSFVACSKKVDSNNLNQASIPNELVDGWAVAGIYYKDNLIDLDDSDSLEDLYDTVWLTINEDGSFCYLNFVNYNGFVETTEEANTFILKTENITKYKSENGKLKEVPDTVNDLKDYVITILSNEMDTLLFNEYDGKNIHPNINESTLVLTKGGNATSYILQNKANINSSSNTQLTTNSYSNYDYSSYTTKSYYTTSGEQNALERAYDYLECTAFSYKGLVEQLEYEGYLKSEAEYAADNCGADWNEQAVKKAKQYLECSSFSRKGLIEQLEYEGFTTSQAEYGVSVAY